MLFGCLRENVNHSPENLEVILENLVKADFVVNRPATSSTWGYRAVVLDPEGRKVELIEKSG